LQPNAPSDDDQRKRWEIEDVLHLAVAQDQTTWLAMTVFVAAEAVLMGAAVAAQVETVLRFIVTGVGLALTVLSYLMLDRSNRYLVKYWQILSGITLDGSTLPRFNVTVGGFRAWRSIQALYLVLGIAWLFLLLRFSPFAVP